MDRVLKEIRVLCWLLSFAWRCGCLLAPAPLSTVSTLPRKEERGALEWLSLISCCRAVLVVVAAEAGCTSFLLLNRTLSLLFQHLAFHTANTCTVRKENQQLW